tara:strand:- start:156 stop:284 length:129 start_codon:yes stop_codon:yes gene_type:complete
MNDDTKKYDSLTNYEVIIYMALGATLGMSMTIFIHALKTYCG